MEEKIILNTSDEAATYRTGLEGWVTRNGRFWGEDERMARWDGCTHVLCECGKPVEKSWTKCPECRRASAVKRFEAMPKKVWDGESPLCLFDDDCFFWSQDDLTDYCEESGHDPKDLKLVICKPIFARQIDPYDHYHDDIPEEGDLPGELVEAFDRLNEKIRECREPLSWEPGSYAAEIREETLEKVGAGYEKLCRKMQKGKKQ